MLSLTNSRPALKKLICTVATLYLHALSRYFRISFLWYFIFNLRSTAVETNMGRTSALKNGIVSNWEQINCKFSRLELHACALTRTISLSYHGILLVSVLFHLVT